MTRTRVRRAAVAAAASLLALTLGGSLGQPVAAETTTSAAVAGARSADQLVAWTEEQLAMA